MTAGKLLPPTTIYPCFKEGPLLILKYNVDKKKSGLPPYYTKLPLLNKKKFKSVVRSPLKIQ